MCEVGKLLVMHVDILYMLGYVRTKAGIRGRGRAYGTEGLIPAEPT